MNAPGIIGIMLVITISVISQWWLRSFFAVFVAFCIFAAVEEAKYWARLGKLILLLFLLPSAASAEMVVVQSQDCANNRCAVQQGSGSGVIIGELRDRRAAVLTAGHVVRDATAVHIRWYEGQWLSASVLAARTDTVADLAVLAVRIPGKWTCNEVSSQLPPSSASVLVAGFPGANVPALELRGTIAGNTVQSVTARGGMSGGPVLYDGRVVGIVRGFYSQGKPDTNCTSGPVITQWLHETLGYIPADPHNRTAKPAVKPSRAALVPRPPEDLPALPIVAKHSGETAAEILAGQRPKFVTPVVASPPLPPSPTIAVAAPVIPPVASAPPEVIAQPATGGVVTTIGKVADVAATAWTIAQWGGLIGATGGIGGLVMGGIALARTFRRIATTARAPPVEHPQPITPQPPRQSPLPSPITIENPPPPQVVIPETRFTPVERETFSEAYTWAVGKYVGRNPGAEGTMVALDALIWQYLESKGIKRPKSQL